MSEKHGSVLKDADDDDFTKPSFEELCQQDFPTQWRAATALMWLVFLGFVGVSIFNQYSRLKRSAEILQTHSEVQARLVDVIQIVEDGKLTDYAVDLEYDFNGEIKDTSIDVPEDEYEALYDGRKTIPVIVVSPDEINLKSYYERNTNRPAVWLKLSIGYLIVFVLLFLGRHYLLRSICKK